MILGGKWGQKSVFGGGTAPPPTGLVLDLKPCHWLCLGICSSKKIYN